MAVVKEIKQAVVTFYPEVMKAFLASTPKLGPAIPIPITNPPTTPSPGHQSEVSAPA